MSAVHDELKAWIEREPFEAFVIETADGRRIEVRQRNLVVLNALAVSVVEQAFTLTVLGLDQVRGLSAL